MMSFIFGSLVFGLIVHFWSSSDVKKTNEILKRSGPFEIQAKIESLTFWAAMGKLTTILILIKLIAILFL